MIINRSMYNVLYVDLDRNKYRVESRPDLFETYIGGSGVASRLLMENCPEGADPFGPDNPIIFAVGPLVPLFPLASKTVAMFKSPHTGNLGESHCGGRSSVSISMAGVGAIVIKGKSRIPVYLVIENGKVHFRDASALWGMRSNFTTGRILRQKEKGSGRRSIIRIGLAGERQIPFSCVTAETFRHFGRMGLGSVFGSKNLKALVITGSASFDVASPKEYKNLYKEIHDSATRSSAMRKYHDLGTACNVESLSAMGGLPTRNMSSGSFEHAEDISGQSFAKEHLGRRLACSHCPVGCIHIAALRDPDTHDPYFYKTSMIGYDYEPIFALGSMLGIGDKFGFLKLMHRIEEYGLDVMSAGVLLAWATEAMNTGLVKVSDTGGLKLSFGDWPSYIECIDRLVGLENDFYKALAGGAEHASGIYGGREFAMAFGKNEMAGYHTGPAAHIGLMIGARHSHLDNGGYSMDQNELVKKLIAPEELVEKLIAEESWRQILSSLVVCFFARAIYTPEIVSEALHQSGLGFDKESLMRTGREILAEKYRFKAREGFSFENMRIPSRIFETPSPVKNWDEAYVRSALKHASGLLVQP